MADNIKHSTEAWGVLWRANSKKHGRTEHLVCHRKGVPHLFPTREEARSWIWKVYRHLDPDSDSCNYALRKEPYGWRLPKAVKVVVTVKEK